MPAPAAIDRAKKRSLRALEAANFFLADVQTGLGPFLAAYLAAAGWTPGSVGQVLTLGGAVGVVLQTPAGAIVDQVRSKRAIIVCGVLVLGAGAVLLSLSTAPWPVYVSQLLIGSAAPFLGPTLAAITMGLTGRALFDRQFGRNQSFNSAGNVACALAILAISRGFGNRGIFVAAALLTLPTITAVLAIRGSDIDHSLARGGDGGRDRAQAEPLFKVLTGDRVLLVFLVCAIFFHLANAAMLPQLGEMIAHGAKGRAAALMSACILVTQLVIACSAATVGKLANGWGRKPLLLVGFGVLPVRAVLYTLTHATASLIAIQVLDGVANSIFGVVSILVIADRTRGSGRFNLVQGELATGVGIGASLSNLLGGKIVDWVGFNASFLALGSVAAIAFLLLVFVPETLASEAGPALKGRAAD
jgi:MFS family permease